jgi:soluble lytic murein transglycosylase-like protein
MKSWMLVAALLTVTAAPAVAADLETDRVELVGRIRAVRDMRLPAGSTDPIVLRYGPRLTYIEVAARAALDRPAFDRAKRDFEAWNEAFLREQHAALPATMGRVDFAAFKAMKDASVRQVLSWRSPVVLTAAQQVGSWGGRQFDNSASRTEVNDGAVRAESYAVNDPRRYARLKNLLLNEYRAELSRSRVSRATAESRVAERAHIIDTAITEGIRLGVDPQLVLSVIAQESNFRVRAYNSGSGAMGLMQVLPSTAEGDLGVSRNRLFSVRDNIVAGIRYLKEKLPRYLGLGRVDLSNYDRLSPRTRDQLLAAYNWGAGNVRSWARGAKRMVAETRDYIAEIPARLAGWLARLRG